MKLATHTWGRGEKTAVLIHGLFSSGTNWHSLADELASGGYTVIAVDLPGHGFSPRAQEYTFRMIAASMRTSVPHAPDLLVGHSLGGFTARMISAELEPRRIVYVDPAFMIGRPDGMEADKFGDYMSITEASVRAENPRWTDTDVHIELMARSTFDTEFMSIWPDGVNTTYPATPVAPSLVLLASDGSVVSPEEADGLRTEGYEVRVVDGTGHNLHRDDPAAVNAAVLEWAGIRVPVAA